MMVTHETFRRVQKVRGPGRPLAYCSSRRNAEARSRVSQAGRCKPESSRPQKKKAKDGQPIFRFPRTCFLVDGIRFFVLLRRQSCVGQTLSHDLRTKKAETIRVIHRIVTSG